MGPRSAPGAARARLSVAEHVAYVARVQLSDIARECAELRRGLAFLEHRAVWAGNTCNTQGTVALAVAPRGRVQSCAACDFVCPAQRRAPSRSRARAEL